MKKAALLMILPMLLTAGPAPRESAPTNMTPVPSAKLTVRLRERWFRYGRFPLPATTAPERSSAVLPAAWPAQ